MSDETITLEEIETELFRALGCESGRLPGEMLRPALRLARAMAVLRERGWSLRRNRRGWWVGDGGPALPYAPDPVEAVERAEEKMR